MVGSDEPHALGQPGVQTSEVTVRRDVRALEAEGLLDRRHGG
ncbi:DeoR family transcriptional regulator, partial [Streptomyces sp. NPDC052015]